jgi:hypothetical protein
LKLFVADLLVLGSRPCVRAHPATLNVVHAFKGAFSFKGNDDGVNPLYLVASGGTVFRINTDGTGLTNLHSFTPVIAYGGSNLDGGLSQEPDGFIRQHALRDDQLRWQPRQRHGVRDQHRWLGFTNLYNFTAPSGPNYTNSDGKYPVGALILSGNTLYGTAQNGGAAGKDTVFNFNTGDSGFSNLYDFTATGITDANSDGASPYAAGLVLSDKTRSMAPPTPAVRAASALGAGRCLP